MSSVTVSLTLTTNVDATQVMDLFAQANGYESTVNGSPNPMTSTDFVEGVFASMIVQQVQYIREKVARDAAVANVRNTPIQVQINISSQTNPDTPTDSGATP